MGAAGLDRMKIKRWVVQTASLIALNSSFASAALGLRSVCTPVLNCHACYLAWFACPIGVFIHYSGYQIFPFIAVGTVLLFGALLGRLLCGWVCPMGLVQDLLHKIPSPKFKLPNWTAYIKYALLIGTAFITPWFLGEKTFYSFCRICPSGTLQGAIPNLFFTGFHFTTITYVRLIVLVSIIAFAVTSYRSFCKTMCPIGAIMAPLNHLSAWAMKPLRSSCLDCRKCDTACGMDAMPSTRVVKDVPANRALECIVCYECHEPCAEITEKLKAAAKQAP